MRRLGQVSTVAGTIGGDLHRRALKRLVVLDGRLDRALELIVRVLLSLLLCVRDCD